MNTSQKKIKRCPKFTHKLPISPFRNTIIIKKFHHFHPFFLRNSKNPNHSHLDLTLAHKMNIRTPKFPKALAVRACGRETLFNSYLFTCIFRNFQKFISAKLFGISEISCYHLKRDIEYFSQKNQRCPKSTHKLPISPFSKFHKIP